jgi:serine/threonine-protein kinase RsbW
MTPTQPKAPFCNQFYSKKQVLINGKCSFMAQREYSFEFKNSLAELDILCRHLETFSQKFELSKKFTLEINLALEELFTNIICYGFDDHCEHIISMTITLENDELCICIVDDGIPFNPIKFAVPEMSHSIEECKIGGLGIHIVRKMVDDICYQRCDDKNILTLKKNVKTSS